MRNSKAKAIRRTAIHYVGTGRSELAVARFGERKVRRACEHFTNKMRRKNASPVEELQRAHKMKAADVKRRYAQAKVVYGDEVAKYEPTTPPAVNTDLTPAQQRVWDLHQQGKTNEEIAAELGISESGVRGRLTEARKKLG